MMIDLIKTNFIKNALVVISLQFTSHTINCVLITDAQVTKSNRISIEDEKHHLSTFKKY